MTTPIAGRPLIQITISQKSTIDSQHSGQGCRHANFALRAVAAYSRAVIIKYGNNTPRVAARRAGENGSDISGYSRMKNAGLVLLFSAVYRQYLTVYEAG